MEWFRLYHELLDDPKAQKLPPPLFKFWVNLLCLASAQPVRGALPDMEEIAFRLRVSDEEAEININTLIEKGLVDKDETTEILYPHGWKERQKDSDDVAKRVAVSRANKNKASNFASNATVTLQETPLKHDVTVTPKEAEQMREEAEKRQSRAEADGARVLSPIDPQEASAPPASAFLEQAPVPPASMPLTQEKPPPERVITVSLERQKWDDLLKTPGTGPGKECWKRHEIWAGLEVLSERKEPPRDVAALLVSKILPEIRDGTKQPARLTANAPPPPVIVSDAEREKLIAASPDRSRYLREKAAQFEAQRAEEARRANAEAISA